jgi:hypothetical protein
MICRICRRSRARVLLDGLVFVEQNLCEECGAIKAALLRMHAEKGGVNLMRPEIRAELLRRAGIGQAVGHA